MIDSSLSLCTITQIRDIQTIVFLFFQENICFCEEDLHSLGRKGILSTDLAEAEYISLRYVNKMTKWTLQKMQHFQKRCCQHVSSVKCII